MRHGVGGRKLGRRTSHKEAMLQNLACSIFRYGKVITTVAKAKEVRSLVEHQISVSKKGDLASRRYVLRFIPDKEIVKKVFDSIANWNPERKSGFTRILKMGWRKGDAAPMALIELVDRPKEILQEKAKGSKESKKEKIVDPS